MITELDFLKLKAKINNLACNLGQYKKEQKQLHNRELKPEIPVDKYIKDKVKEEFRMQYNEIYEQNFILSERIDKLENKEEL